MTKNKINFTFSDKNRQMNNRGWIYIYHGNKLQQHQQSHLYLIANRANPAWKPKNVRLPTFLKCQRCRPYRHNFYCPNPSWFKMMQAKQVKQVELKKGFEFSW